MRTKRYRPAATRTPTTPRRRRLTSEAVDREDLGIEKRVGAADRDACRDPRVGRQFDAARARVRDVVAAVAARIVQRSTDGDNQIVVVIEKYGGRCRVSAA